MIDERKVTMYITHGWDLEEISLLGSQILEVGDDPELMATACEKGMRSAIATNGLTGQKKALHNIHTPRDECAPTPTHLLTLIAAAPPPPVHAPYISASVSTTPLSLMRSALFSGMKPRSNRSLGTSS